MSVNSFGVSPFFARRSIAMLLFAIILVGCASGNSDRFRQRGDFARNLKNISIIADVTVIHERNQKPVLLVAPENAAIADHLANVAAAVLKDKGYGVAGDPVRSVGLSGIDHHVSVAYSKPSDDIFMPPSEPPFILKPSGGRITARKLKVLLNDLSREILMAESSPFGNIPILVITARGRYADAVPEVTPPDGSIMITYGSPNRQSLRVARDHLIMTMRLFDPRTGAMLWKDEVSLDSEPNTMSFSGPLTKMLDALPQARYR